MNQLANILFALLRAEVCGTEPDESCKEALTPEVLPRLYALAKHHDLAHIVAAALDRLGLLSDDEVSEKFRKQQFVAVYRYERLQYELTQVSGVLEDAGIAFVPLKGSVLRQYYPEPWMRTSCDIDILVHEEDLDRAAEVLVSRIEYRKENKGSHDLQMFSPSGIHLELHYNLIEEIYDEGAHRLLSGVWEYLQPEEGYQYRFRMTDAMFYFYHVAHMAKHFSHGGCGIRPFMDLWILEHRMEHSDEARNELLEQGGLRKFAEAGRALSEVWFAGESEDELSGQMANYILTGGVYGNLDNMVAVQRTQRGGKLRYLLSRVFLPYEVIKFHYPVLEKHRWLTPFYEVRRWFKLLQRGRMKRSLHELNVTASISGENAAQTDDLIRKLGL